jgi:IS4 transposase
LILADREGDCFDYFAAERRANTDLLVRSRHPRRVLVEAPREVPVPRRAGRPQVLHETEGWGTLTVTIPRTTRRPERQAQLAVRGVQVWLQPAEIKKADDALRPRTPQRVWVVEAKEVDPPEGVEAVHWVLLSTRPATTLEQAQRLLNYYRRRWVIEELHLVLKSGLRAERLQMEEADTLKPTLALLYLVAWRVLYVRDTARFLPETPAAELVTVVEQQVLEAAEGRPLPTARDIVRAIAHLGGFPRYPSAGEPGVRSLWDGFRRLEGVVLGWQLAHRH